MARLSDVSPGDVITSQRQNDINDYINDGTEHVNTAYVQVAGTTVIDSNRYITPVRIVNPDSDGTLVYDSAGTTLVAKIDDNGNLFIKGRVISL